MSKRVLSLFLALVMLVLAVPVFALPTLAAEADPIVNFVVGAEKATTTKEEVPDIAAGDEPEADPDDSKSDYLVHVENYGTKIKSVQWSEWKGALPTDAELEATGVSASSILTWVWWSKTDKKFYDIRDFISGAAALPTDVAEMDFTPLYYTASNFGQGNLPYYEVDRYNNSNGGSYLQDVAHTMHGFRGGIIWEGFANGNFFQYDNVDCHYYILSAGDDAGWWSEGGAYVESASVIVASGATAATAISHQVIANDATMTVTVPKASGIYYAVIVDNEIVYGGNATGYTAKSDVGKTVANWATFGLSTDEGYAEKTDATVTFEVRKGQTVRVAIARNGVSSVNGFNPTFTYTKIHDYKHYTNFLSNRPAVPPVAKDDPASSPVQYKGNWNYMSYTCSSTGALTDPLVLTDRWHTGTEEWILPSGITTYRSTNGFVNANESATELGTDAWPLYAIGVPGTNKAIGAVYTAEHTGDIAVSIDRLATSAIAQNSTNDPDATKYICTTLAYAIYVNGEKVWPVNNTGAWYEIPFYGTDVPAEERAANSGVIGKNMADTALNATMPDSVFVEKGDTVSFLIKGVSTSRYTPATEEGAKGTFTERVWDVVNSRWNYFDGAVMYKQIYVHSTDFLGNRPQNIDYNLSGVGASELITYRGGWDYITYPTGDRGYAEPLTRRYAITETEEWYLTATGTNYYSVSVNANGSSSELSTTSYWPGYGMLVPQNAVIGTRYTSEYNGPIALSLDRVMSTTDPGATKRLTLGYAIYVGGEKVWPAGDSWYKVAYCGTSIPQEDAAIVAAGAAAYDAIVTYSSTSPVNIADKINATLPTDLYVNKGEKVEFLVKGIDLENYTAPTAEGESGTYATASYSGNASRGNYVDGKVLFIRKDSISAPQTPPTTSFATQKPYLNLNADQSKSAVFSANWDYVVYANMAALQSGHAGNSLSQRTVNGTEGWLVQPGDYEENVAGCNLNSPAYVYFSTSNKHTATLKMWADGTIGFHSKTAVAGTRYIAEYNGVINLSFSELSNWQNGDKKNTHTYAIYQNGKQIWPVDSEGVPTDWYTLAYGYTASESEYAASYGVNYAGDVNDTMPSQIYVQKGDAIQFLVAGSPEITDQYYSRSNVVEGVVEYTEIYETPTAQAGLSVGESLSIYGQTDGVPAEATEFGVYLNGEKKVLSLESSRFSVKVNAKDANKDQTIKPYYVRPDSKIVVGETYTVTVNDMLNDYAASGDASIAAAAEATLNYTAAADAYFNDEVTEAPEIVAPAGKDAYVEKSESIGVSEYEGENKIKFRGISLLLNDLVNIKIVVDGTLPEGATLQISKSASFDELETLISGKATDDGTGTKFVMDGISAQNWNTDYYIRVVDADKNVISDTLCYSVAAYYGRMIDRAEASDKLKAVISSLMSLYEAVSTAN